MRRLRTIMAVARKEIILLMRYPTWIIETIIWPFIFPLMYILSALGFAGPNREGIQTFSNIVGTQNYVGFIVAGTMAWMWINVTMWDFGTYLREEQMRGTLESNWLCPINKFDYLIGACVVSILYSAILCSISVTEYKFLYRVDFKRNAFIKNGKIFTASHGSIIE